MLDYEKTRKCSAEPMASALRICEEWLPHIAYDLHHGDHDREGDIAGLRGDRDLLDVAADMLRACVDTGYTSGAPSPALDNPGHALRAICAAIEWLDEEIADCEVSDE